MKNIRAINYTFLVFVLFFWLGSLANEESYVYALLFIAIFGFVQIILSIIMLFKYPGKLLTFYAVTTFLYLLALMIVGIDNYYIFIPPPVLALLLTYIIYKERQKEKALLEI